MKQKIDLAKMLKKVAGNKKTETKKPASLSRPGEVDMRQHAIDIGAHEAKDYFMGGTA